MGTNFTLTRLEQGTALLCVALSAIFVYAPCRWNFRPIAPPDARVVRQYLPYLYLLFFASLPIQLFKNYRYYQYVQHHGGYTIIFVNHSALAATVPFLVRVIPLITFPVLLAICVIEHRRKLLFLVTVLYFSTATFILLLGSRASTFALVMVLWFVARMKSDKKSNLGVLIAMALVLGLTAGLIQTLREGPDSSQDDFLTPIEIVALQGASLNVTEVAVKFRDYFSPYSASYLTREIQNAFVANDAANYYRGRAFAFDLSVFLNPSLFSGGYGTGSSYVAESYVAAGFVGVIVLSLCVGGGLHFMHRMSGLAFSLFLVATIFPDVLLMPRNGLLDWVSVLLRSLISIALIWMGWKLYSLLVSIRGSRVRETRAVGSSPAGS
jgi:oligosaccharide repeat unit polymerase